MSLFICSLNSGSNGNCYYLGNSREAILIDAGISCRETEKRMKRLGLSMEKVKAIFISHEHSDHINGVENLSRKFQVPVYITPDTLKFCRLRLQSNLVFPFKADESISVGNISITPFTKFHDASDPHSFIVSSNGISVGVFTDLGNPCSNVIRYFQQCHAAFLESNYDEEMLEKGGYPYHLKKRIRGEKGHLSNKQALEVFIQYRPAFMSHLFLSHLSKNNNCPDVARKLFSENAGGVKVVVASRYEETALYFIEEKTVQPGTYQTIIANNPARKHKTVAGLKYHPAGNVTQLSIPYNVVVDA